ncbi:oxidoreductase [Streptomyces agglomeratus]|uniref:Oxidoreductase n=1 Tax=Streptomyces agglomeratus TaxID=285458 RepID=A0A1E5PG40_9ACTN|nr:oxidoreductase [Streptomyces agglomeratus]OEJ28492.1 oxidoreductase [Streptomyces agglomeratus]OEJ37444.1 oxidoreductase [Streptomyces agglomeratus]OEJ48171.1 oxidoreductase [Streptomyces agglomeratus]OEJ49986.1 oxidoreductase [Streptomyces agglomeratus]OEJ57314.1 oxidoreductase [Streptomyces agglomeratus]
MLSYDEMTPPERELWDAFPEGRQVDLRAGATGGDDPAGGADWGPERTLRAAVVTALARGGSAAPPGAVTALRVAGARITGRLDLSGADIGHLLWFEGCWFEEGPSFYGAATRTIGIIGSRVPGLDATMARIEGRLDLRRSVLHSRVSLVNARVAGELALTGAALSDPDGLALSAGGLVMEGGIFARDLTTRGEVRLVGAQLSGGLFMEGARLENPGASALVADNALASTLVFSQGFGALGTVRLRGAQTTDQLTFRGATLSGDRVALDCSRMQAGDLDLTPAAPPTGAVDLQGAQIAVLHDSEDAWPDVVRLQGLVYGSLQPAEGARDDVARRVAWIRREPGYAPQPYEQLASWYRKVGHDDDARRVLLAKQRHRRSVLGTAGRAWGHLLDAVVGYGYRPWLAGVWIAALTVLGTWVFRAQSPQPVKAGEGPPFNALVYTLDLLIPIGGLGQRSSWYWPEGPAQWLSYTLIAAGWLLTTAVVAGVTRSLNKT